MWTIESKDHGAPSSNVTITSTSLSGPKSSRTTLPKKENSVIFHLRQKSRSFSLS
jgi:hypothetical protein